MDEEERRILVTKWAEGIATRAKIGDGFKPEDWLWIREKAQRIVELSQDGKK